MSIPESSADAGTRLFLLGGMSIDNGFERVEPPPSIGRTIAFVALSAPDPVNRCRLAGELWGDHSDERATANLRSALWRCRQFSQDLLLTTVTTVSLHPDVWLDVHHLTDVIRSHAATGRLGHDGYAVLLPGWNDDWVLFSRERLRQRLLRRLEEECESCLERGNHEGAVDLALQAVSFEPFRENPHRLLIEAHIGQGDVFEAMREYDRFNVLLEREFGIAPSASLQGLARRMTDGLHRSHS